MTKKETFIVVKGRTMVEAVAKHAHSRNETNSMTGYYWNKRRVNDKSSSLGVFPLGLDTVTEVLV